MQTEELTPPRKTPRVRIIWLVGVHIVAGLLLGMVTARAVNERDPILVLATFLGLVFSQTSLLGIWGGLGTNRWWIRLVGVLVGIGYLGPQCGICIDNPGGEFILIVAFATLIVTAVLLLARRFGFRTRLDSDQNTPAKEMQFSIRHLMILTLVVACVLALAKWQPGDLDLDGSSFLGVLVAFLTAIAVPFATVGLVAAWGVLGTMRPLIGVVVLFVAAVGAAYGMARILGPEPGFPFWIIATLTEATSLTVSLLLVRSWGYRLRRRAAQQLGSDPGKIENSV